MATRVSIGMPVRDCATTVRAAIRSILAQTLHDWRLFVVDDGSSDATVDAVRSFQDPRITLLADGHQLGLPVRLNQTLSMSEGDYFARMDGDDISYPRRLERQVEFLELHSDVDLVGTRVIVFGRRGKALGTRRAPERHEEICRRPFAGFALAHPTYLGRLRWFRRHPYEPSALRCEDQVLLLEAFDDSRFANLSDILLGYREERLILAKLLSSRLHFSRAVFRRYWGLRRPLLAARGVFEQGIKAGADALAIATGLDHRLLRHRARPVSDDELRHWAEVWAAIAPDE